MRHYSLTNQERANTGYTDCFVVLFSDLTSTSGQTHTVNLCALKKNDVVKSDLVVEVVTPFAHANNGTTVEIGYTDDFDAFIDVKVIQAAAGTSYLMGDGSGATNVGYIEDADSKYVVCKVSVTTSVVNTCTAGEIRIWANINRAADSQAVQA